MHELRQALRQFLRAPGFSLMAAGTLALGIGAATAVFSVANGLLLRPLDYPEPDRIVRLLEFSEDGTGRGTISAPNFFDWMEQSRTLAVGALYDEYRPTVELDGESIKMEAASVGAAYFEVLGVEPLLGRFFLPEEDEPGSNRVVLTRSLWQEVFGADPDIVGQSISLDGTPYTVVGVAPSMENPELSFSVREPPRLWRSTPEYFLTNGRGGRSFTAIARLRPDATVEGAQADLSSIHRTLAELYPESNSGQVVHVEPLLEDLVGEVRPILWLLLAAAGLVLLIACANVANLLLVRFAARSREIGLRAALGAARARVVRQLLTESFILALAGAAGGILLAVVATRALVDFAAGQLPRADAVGMDFRVLGFAVFLACATTVMFGVLPALQASRLDLRRIVGGAQRGSAAGPGRTSLRRWIVAVQAGLAVVVMLGAGLLGRSLLELQAVDPGVAVDRVLVLRIDPPSDRYNPSDEAGRAELLGLYDQLEETLAALPGVEAVGTTDLLPMSGSFNGNQFTIEGEPVPEPGQEPRAEVRAVSPGYFETMGIPLLDGRPFAATDDEPSERVVLVNEALARLHFPEGDAVGARLSILDPDREPARIVGVVGDVSQFTLDQAPEPVAYVPVGQAPNWMQDEPWLALRTSGAPEAVLASARETIRGIEPRTPIYSAQPMTSVLSGTLAQPRFRTFLVLAFAAVSFLLAATGVFGIVAYSVVEQRRELGIRMALGAGPRRILSGVLGLGIRPVVAGALAGVVVGLAGLRALDGFLYGVSTTDPVTFALAPLLLVATGLAACWLPARRAAQVDPMTVLREE